MYNILFLATDQPISKSISGFTKEVVVLRETSLKTSKLYKSSHVLGILLQYTSALRAQINVILVLHPVCIWKKKLRNCTGGQPYQK